MNIKNQLKSLVLAATLVGLTWAGSVPQRGGYELKGTIQGIESGKVKLTRYNEADRTATAIDSAIINNGKFEMTGTLAGPEMLSFTVTPGNWIFSVFVENNKISILADTIGAQHYDYPAPGGSRSRGARISTLTVRGSSTHAQHQSLAADPEEARLLAEVMALREKGANAVPEDQQTIRRQSDSLRRLLNVRKEQQIEQLIKADPASVAGVYAFQQYAQMNNQLPLEKRESILSQFKGEALASPYFKLLNEDYQIRAALSPGRVAPDFTALHPDSTEFILSSTRGKYVLLDFWASWCAPCRASIPHWKEVYEKYHDKGLEIVAVTNDSRWSDWFKALEEENMPWIQVADEFPVQRMPARIATQYKVPSLPSYILLDPEGKILIYRGSKEEITTEIGKRLDNKM